MRHIEGRKGRGGGYTKEGWRRVEEAGVHIVDMREAKETRRKKGNKRKERRYGSTSERGEVVEEMGREKRGRRESRGRKNTRGTAHEREKKIKTVETREREVMRKNIPK